MLLILLIFKTYMTSPVPFSFELCLNLQVIILEAVTYQCVSFITQSTSVLLTSTEQHNQKPSRRRTSAICICSLQRVYSHKIDIKKVVLNIMI